MQSVTPNANDGPEVHTVLSPHSNDVLYTWEQSLDDVNVYVHATAQQLQKSSVKIQMGNQSLFVAIEKPGKDEDAVLLDGQLCGHVKADESTWTIERLNTASGKSEIHITLCKAYRGQPWPGVLRGSESTDAADADNRRIMLQRFQEEHPGFDFSHAQFNGQVPDASTFMGGIQHHSPPP